MGDRTTTPTALPTTSPQIVARAITLRSFFTRKRTAILPRAFSSSLGSLYTPSSDPQPLPKILDRSEREPSRDMLTSASTTSARLPILVESTREQPKSTGRRHSLLPPVAAIKRVLSFRVEPKAPPVRDRDAILELARTLSRRRSNADQAAIEQAAAPVQHGTGPLTGTTAGAFGRCPRLRYAVDARHRRASM